MSSACTGKQTKRSWRITLGVGVFMCAEKSEHVALISCSIFIRWSVNMGRSSKTLCDDHAEFLTLSENYRILSVVTRPWQNSSWTSLTVQYRSTDQEPKSQKSPRLFHNANVSSGTVCLGFKETAQLKKICLRSVLITFPLNCENIISECSMNVQISCFFKCKKNSYAYADIKGTYH